MLNILLGILKVIGILLLVVLSLILIAILILLLGPICYKASGTFREDKACSASVSWLGFVLRAKVDYAVEKGTLWAVRLFGILIASNDEEFIRKKEEKQRIKEEKRRRKEEKERIKASEKQRKQEEEIQELPTAAIEDSMTQNLENVEAAVPEETVPSEELSISREDDFIEENQVPFDSSDSEKSRKKFSVVLKEKLIRIREAVSRLVEKIKAIPAKIRKFIDGIKQKIEIIKGKIARIMEFKEFFLGERNREGFLHVLHNLKKMAVHILPRRLEGNVDFGVEDPCVMGQILTVLSIFYPVYQDRFTIHPDFEKPGFAGDISLKGRIIPGYLVLRFMIALCNREVIRIIKELKQLIGGNKA